jgi:hypothetical protein
VLRRRPITIRWIFRLDLTALKFTIKIMKFLFAIFFLVLGSASPAYAAQFLGSFSISGIRGPTSDIRGNFMISFDESQDRVLDFAPDHLDVQIGENSFGRIDTLFDFIRLPQLQQQTGQFSLLFGRVNAAPRDTNNVMITTTVLPDYTIRFLLDANFNFVGARGGYVLPGVTQIFSFDTSLGDGSIANLSLRNISAVPEPESWMMLISGFLMIGYALRMRRHHFSVRLSQPV